MIRPLLFIVFGLVHSSIATPCIAVDDRPAGKNSAATIAERLKSQAAMLEVQNKRTDRIRENRAATVQAAGGEAQQRLADQESTTLKMEGYFSRKTAAHLQRWQALEEKLEASRIAMVDERASQVIVYEKTLNLTDLDKIRPGIRSGDLINRFFMHINVATGLNYGQSLSPTFAAQLQPLSTDLLKVIRLERASKYGPIAVSLATTMPEIFDLWPYAFYEPTLKPEVALVTDAAKALYVPNLGIERKKVLAVQFQNRLASLKREFLRLYPPSLRRQMPTIQLRRVLAAEDFLIQIERAVQTRAETNTTIVGEIPAYLEMYPADHQRNIATLIHYTQRYGLEILPAMLGSEYLYDQLFEETRTFATLVDAAPTRESIMDPMINMDLDALLTDSQASGSNPSLKPTGK